MIIKLLLFYFYFNILRPESNSTILENEVFFKLFLLESSVLKKLIAITYVQSQTNNH